MMRMRRGAVLAAALAVTACGGDGGSGPTPVPASVTVTAGSGQVARYGTAVATAPTVSVKDAGGLALSGVEVTFTVTAGGGSVANATARTNAGGLATAGPWTMGPQPGTNGLKATAGTVSATLSATATAGPAATLAVQAGDGQTGAANTPTPVRPAVLVTDGTFPVNGQRVTFAVTGGGGTVSSATVLTDSLGIATVDEWRLGAVGPQQLTATSTGLPTVTFTATSEVPVLTSIAKVGGDAVSGFAGNFTPTLPALEARNQSGAGIAGVSVTFAVAGGGGAANFTTVTTGSDGRASPGSWRFGSAGQQSMTATVAGLPTVTFTATAEVVPASQFNIQVVFLDPQPTDAQKAAFLAARDRWQRIIIGDVPDFAPGIPANLCGIAPVTSIPGPIDDVVIFVSVDSIDGRGGTLGQAGPCLGRSNGSITIAGIVQFDRADVGYLGGLAGGLTDVAFHEFAHVLGFGNNWPDVGTIQFPGSDAVVFTGAAGKQAYAALLNPASNPSTFDVPVENCVGFTDCGPGNRDTHWREMVFGAEIMTGFYNSGVLNPFSAMSAASMRDLGYVVDDATATNPYVLPLVLGGFRAGAATGTPFREALAPWPVLLLDDRGNVVRELRR